MKIRVNEGPFKCRCIICPNCGAHELLNCHLKDEIPHTQWRWQIRPFKVDNWSHCMVCGCWFTLDGKVQGNRNVPMAPLVFSKAREVVKRSVPDADNLTKMNVFVSVCRVYNLKMENWTEKFDKEQIDIMAEGYGLV